MTLKTILSITLILFLKICIAQQNPKIITVDASRIDKLNISQIAEEVIVIPLKDIPMNEPRVTQVAVTADNLYVCLTERASGTNMEIFQVEMDGTLIRQVGIKSEENDQYIKATGLFYLEKTKELAISYKNNVAVFDDNGKLKRKIENISFRDFHQAYNNKIWYMLGTLEKANNRYSYTLVSKDLTTLRNDTLYSYNHHTSENESVFPGCSFSIADNKLYFTNEYEKEIYSVNNNNRLEKSYQFKFKNLEGKSVDTIIHPGRIVFNNYIYYGYRDYSKNNFCFITNKTNGESYNLRLHIKNGAFVTSINDDIYSTGYFRLNKTSSGDYACDTKLGYDVSDKIQGIKDESTPVIFLMKHK